MQSNRALDEIFMIAPFSSLWRQSAVERGLFIKQGLGYLGYWQTVQTQIRRRRTRLLIRVCTVCLNYRNLRVEGNSLKSPLGMISPAYTHETIELPLISALSLCLVSLESLRNFWYLAKLNYVLWGEASLQTTLLSWRVWVKPRLRVLFFYVFFVSRGNHYGFYFIYILI